jgi:hypothetical protein
MNDTKAVPNPAQKKQLERAAKAAGLNHSWSVYEGFRLLGGAVPHLWNPFEDNGDAMTLASKLQMSLKLDHNGAEAWIGDKRADGRGVDEPFAALRVAIVRLAEKLGEQC